MLFGCFGKIMCLKLLWYRSTADVPKTIFVLLLVAACIMRIKR